MLLFNKWPKSSKFNKSFRPLLEDLPYVSFVDQTVHAFLPDRNQIPELHDLVKLYQLHRHSGTYRKYKNYACKFIFGKIFAKG